MVSQPVPPRSEFGAGTGVGGTFLQADYHAVVAPASRGRRHQQRARSFINNGFVTGPAGTSGIGGRRHRRLLASSAWGTGAMAANAPPNAALGLAGSAAFGLARRALGPHPAATGTPSSALPCRSARPSLRRCCGSSVQSTNVVEFDHTRDKCGGVGGGPPYGQPVGSLGISRQPWFHPARSRELRHALRVFRRCQHPHCRCQVRRPTASMP